MESMSNLSVLERVGCLFYIVSPQRTSFEKLEEVPDYILEVVPFFAVLFVLESVIAIVKKKKSRVRLNDGFGSLTAGMIQELARAFLRGAELIAYIYVYNNWRIVNLPWNSTWTWIICFVSVDFAYYWFHRAAHEVNFLWASHQVHHSSEDYNLATALRQSVLQSYWAWTVNLPMAFFIPPSIYIVHKEFNLLYQFWIHTELIKSLGPLEYILNTPSHHRVHHGRNRYCIDKNYAGVLIFWDKIFGTFQPEQEKVVYGLTHPVESLNIFYVQFFHYHHMMKTFMQTEGFRNKLSVLLKGPGWSPGKPRLGLIEDIPDVHFPMERYDPQIKFWLKGYCFMHFVLVILGHIELTDHHLVMSQSVALGFLFFQFLSMSSIGALLDNRAYAPFLELSRCLLYLSISYYLSEGIKVDELSNQVFTTLLQTTFLLSALIWTFQCSQMISLKFYTTTKKIA